MGLNSLSQAYYKATQKSATNKRTKKGRCLNILKDWYFTIFLVLFFGEF